MMIRLSEKNAESNVESIEPTHKTRKQRTTARTAVDRHIAPKEKASVKGHTAAGMHTAMNGHTDTRVRTPGRNPTLLSAIALCLAVMLLSSGCSFAQGNFNLAREELPSSHDRLAGLFVTENYIEPAPAQLEYNARGEITFKDPGPQKIYGSLGEYSDASLVSFPDLEGYGIYILDFPADEKTEAARCNSCDSVFTDAHFTVSDEEESIEASLYVNTGRRQSYYFHPVYQQEDGQIYLLPGSGVTTDSFSEGAKFSHGISDSVSHTENGEESTSGYSYTVTIIAEEPPSDMELLFLNDSDQVVRRLSAEELNAFFQADMTRLPELSISEDVSCLILKQTRASGAEISYTAYDRDSVYLEYKVAQGNGPLHIRQLYLLWP